MPLRGPYYESRFLTLGQKLPGHDDKKDKNKLKRVYRAGVKPFEGGDDDDFELLIEEREEEMQAHQQRREIVEARVLHDAVSEEESEEEPVELKPVDLDRLDLNNIKVEQGTAVVEDSDDEDEIERRRQKAREKAKSRKVKPVKSEPTEPSQRVKLKPWKKPAVKQEVAEEEDGEDHDDSESDSDSGSSSSGESSSEDENNGERRRRPKFNFFSKKKRKDMNLESFADTEVRIQEKEVKKRKEKRKKVVRRELIDYIRTQEIDDASSDEEIPDDDDDVDKDAQFELWKLRELKRMKRTQDMLDERQAEEEDTERRRNMTDAEVIAEMKRKPEKSRNRMKFLQKYFHKGAFFQNDEKVVDQKLLNRNLNAAVGTDKWMNFDDTSIPEVMRVKNFGLASRTKYTHLMDQDTTMNRNDGDWNVDHTGLGDAIRKSADHSRDSWGRPTLPSSTGGLDPVQYRQIGGTGPIARPSNKRKVGFSDDQRRPPQPDTR